MTDDRSAIGSHAEADGELTGFARTLDLLEDRSGRPASHAEAFVTHLVPRLWATYLAGASLLRQGFHDQAVMLYRRQLEDSLRLHWLHEHRDEADALVVNFKRWGEQQVLDRIVRTLSRLPAGHDRRPYAEATRDQRQTRIDDLDALIEEHHLDPETKFPGVETMAYRLGRSPDIIPYASASEVSHSAASAASESYREPAREGFTIALYGGNEMERRSYARALINASGFGLYHALDFIREADLAAAIAADAGERVDRLR